MSSAHDAVSLPRSPRLPRRQWMAATAISMAAIGCRTEPQETTDPVAAPVRTDVPLRVVWVGEQPEVDVLRRTWASISEQALDVQLVDPPRDLIATDVATDAIKKDATKNRPLSELFEAAAKSDVVIYPLAMMGELVTRKRVMPLLDDDARRDLANANNDGDDVDAGDVFASVDRVSVPVALRMATTFSRERIAAPMGGHLPALLLNEDAIAGRDTMIATWQQYDALAEDSGGQCCEPTSASWAGAMYLWRLASSLSATWLFDRETLQPLFSQPEYVDVLQQMRTTVRRTDAAFREHTPDQIFRAVVEGRLQGGVGFPQGDVPMSDEASAIRIASLPGRREMTIDEDPLSLQLDTRRIMMDPFMLVGSLASSCRQTAAADVFLKWVAGGPGSEPLFRNIAAMIDTTTAASENASDAKEQYRSWLNKNLTSPAAVPTLQLTAAAEYYAVLDQTVRDCVHGDTPAAKACEQLTDAWSRLHRKHDLPSQQRIWRRAQSIS